MLEGFSNLRVERSPLRMTLEKEGQKLIVNQLSVIRGASQLYTKHKYLV
jgi:hypothetical protein